MKIQFRYRSIGLAALAISLLAIAAFPQTAWAGSANANNARAEVAEERRAANNGQAKKAEPTSTEPSPTANNVDGAGGPTTHGSESGPGGQTCDGDPSQPHDPENVYENTCDSYDDPNNQGSDNGAGDGQATGKPCEGCVGNADDKDPGGQAGGGAVDHNNGYECDMRGAGANQGNNGVGFGNPAHTGCEPTTEEPCEPATGEDENCEPICKPTPSQNADCTEKCKPTATQNADCTEKCKPTATQNADCTEKCKPTATQNADCTEKCKPTATQNADCTEKTCPEGQQMGTDGTCNPPPCVPSPTTVCGQSTPTCVESLGAERCGGASVLGEVLGRPAERLDVLGVSIEAPAVAPAALARTGGFELTALVQAGLVLAMFGLGLTVLGHRRRQTTVDIAGRLAGW